MPRKTSIICSTLQQQYEYSFAHVIGMYLSEQLKNHCWLIDGKPEGTVKPKYIIPCTHTTWAFYEVGDICLMRIFIN